MTQILFVYSQLNGFKSSKWLSNSIWPIGETLTSITTPGQSGLRSNGNELVLNISKIPRLKPRHQIV